MPGTDLGSPRWLLGAYGAGFGLDGDAYLTALWLAFVAYLGVLAFARVLGRRVVSWTIAVAILAFALAPPLLSLDVFSYISYSRLGVVHRLNPYDFAPATIPQDLAASRVQDYREATSVYGPLFTLVTYPLGPIGVPGAMWGLKAIAALSVAAITALVARLAAVRGASPVRAAAFVALNPVVLVQVIGGAHNDALMMLAAVAGVALVLAGANAAGGASLVAAAAVKAPAVVAAPFAFLGAGDQRSRLRLVAGAALAIAAITPVALAAFGSSALDGVSFLSGSQQRVSYHSLPATTARITGLDLEPIRACFLAAYAVGVAGLLGWTARGGDWVRAAAWASFGLLCATVYLTPWYLIWALPLVAVARDRTVAALTLGLSAYQLTVGVPG